MRTQHQPDTDPRRVRRGRTAAGFTLIELLVVLSIIALLSSMVLSAIAVIQDFTRSVQCRANQRQLFLGTQTYAADWRGAVVPSVMHQPDGVSDFFWFLTLAPYLDQGATQHAQLQATNNVAWACPTWARIVGKKSVYTYRTRAGIGLNGNLGLPDTTRSWNTDWTFPSSLTARDVKWREVANLGQRVLLGDSQWSGIDARYYSGVPKWYASVMDPTRHGGRANYAFCDGRVTTLLPSGGTAYSYLDPAQYNP